MKKKLCFFMAVVMLFLLFGCTPQATKETDVSKTDTSSNDSASAENTEKAPRDVKLTIFRAMTTEGMKDKEVIDAICKKFSKDMNYNFSLDIIYLPQPQHNSYFEKLSLMMATNEPLDLYSIGMADYSTIIPQPGFVTPIEDMIDLYGSNIKQRIPADTMDRYRLKGKIYFIPGLDSLNNLQGTIIRKDWLDAMGLEIPKTIEDLENIMEAFRTGDPDKNGKIDTIPMTSQENMINLTLAPAVTGLAPSTFTFPGVWNYLDSKDNRIKPTFINPEYVEMVKLINKWYTKKWLNQDFLITPTDQHYQLFKSGKAGIMMFMWANIAWEDEMKAVNPEAELVNVSHLQGPKGSKQFGRPDTYTLWAVPERSKYKDVAVQFIDWSLANEENYRLVRYGLEGVTYKMVDENTVGAVSEDLKDQNVYSGMIRFVQVNDMELYTALLSPKYNQLQKELTGPGQELLYGATDFIPIVFNEYSTYQAQCDTIRKEWLSKMITGQMSADRYGDFIKEWISKGGDVYIKEATEQYNAYMNSNK